MDDIREFYNEASFMKQLNCKYIVQFLGIALRQVSLLLLLLQLLSLSLLF